MNEAMKTMLRYLTDTSRTLIRIRELEERLASQTIRITQNYDVVGGGGGSGGYKSKVEKYVDDKIMIEEELKRLTSRLDMLEIIKNSNVLSRKEYELFEWLQLGGNLSKFAKQKDLYISNVYKIRDRALNKAIKFIQNNHKCIELWEKC